MAKFTTAQIQAAVKELYTRKDQESLRAYQLGFAELERRMGDEEFDAWLDSWM